MIDWRTLLMAVMAFGATFAGGMWLSGGTPPSLAGLSLAGLRLPSALASAPPAATSVPGRPDDVTQPAALAGSGGGGERTFQGVAGRAGRGIVGRIVQGRIVQGRASDLRRASRSRRTFRVRFRRR
jgi:hypothetical protein